MTKTQKIANLEQAYLIRDYLQHKGLIKNITKILRNKLINRSYPKSRANDVVKLGIKIFNQGTLTPRSEYYNLGD